LKPYKHIETRHLGLLLFVARLFAVFSFLFFGLLLVVLIGIIWGGPLHLLSYLNISITASLFLTLGVLSFSGILAAVVAFEEGFRKRTEAILSNNEI
jgi:uncharacterized protein with PQ loop repeat